MSVITENLLRKMMTEGSIEEKGSLRIDHNTILTPSARTFLTDKNITLLTNKEMPIKEMDNGMNKKTEHQEEIVYETLFGAVLSEKPEHMTHLRGNLLVFKDHPRIVLRGAIDKLESDIIVFQTLCMNYEKNKMTEIRKTELKDIHGNPITAVSHNFQALIDDLEEIIRFIRRLLRSEITGESIESFTLQGLDEKTIREQSYHPSKYFGIKHFLPTYQHGEIVSHLNQLRTRTRQTEIIAFKAFQDKFGQVSRVDIIRGFNRLSSVFWIMMFKWLSGKYQ